MCFRRKVNADGSEKAFKQTFMLRREINIGSFESRSKPNKLDWVWFGSGLSLLRVGQTEIKVLQLGVSLGRDQRWMTHCPSKPLGYSSGLNVDILLYIIKRVLVWHLMSEALSQRRKYAIWYSIPFFARAPSNFPTYVVFYVTYVVCYVT